jgi:hypothetical protein
VKLAQTNFITTTEKRAILGFGPNKDLPEMISSTGAPTAEKPSDEENPDKPNPDEPDDQTKVISIHGRP